MNSPGDEHLLDHSYDDIQEYDNPLPGWWVWIFWATIAFSIYYYMFDSVWGFFYEEQTTVEREYEAAAAAALERQAAKLAELEVTEELIAGLMSDETGMKGMQSKFLLKCATCHKAQGEGDACPNLTDEYWLHGGSLVSIYETIRDGIEGKEMQSWLGDLGPGGTLSMAAYIGTMRNTNVPGGKKPEGIIYKPEETPSTPAAENEKPKVSSK